MITTPGQCGSGNNGSKRVLKSLRNWSLTIYFAKSARSYPSAPLQRDKTLPNECPGYDTKQSDGEVPVMLELWGMQNNSSLPSLQALSGSS